MNQLLAFGVCFISAPTPAPTPAPAPIIYDPDWMSFKMEYGKNYHNNVTEEDIRRKIFKNNSEMINKHNEKFDAGNVTFKMGMNEFGDLTHEEFLKQFSVKEVWHKDANVYSMNHARVRRDSGPLVCDWTKLIETVKTVHNQGKCKAGWAYSAADAIAARCNVSYKKSCFPLSIPYLINCAGAVKKSRGCEGGLAEDACVVVKSKQKMPDERHSFKKDCKLDKMKNTVTLDITKCVTRKHTKADISRELCTNGPVSASISAEKSSFQFAKEGIYYEEDCDNTPNHEVLLVGYKYNGTDQNYSYWIIKNSFGTSWGENGFLKISIKANKSGCKIIGSVSFPVFSKN